MHILVQKYGKQLIKELLDMIVISNKVDSSRIRQVLIDIRMIRTAQITASYRKIQDYMGSGYRHYITVKDNRGHDRVNLAFTDKEIPQLLEDCR